MAKIAVKTRAVVLHTIKYGDSSLVVKMLTEELGIQSYMVKGVFGKKSKMKAALFQNMTLLDIVAESGNSSLGFIKELSLSHYYSTVFCDVKKTTIAMFVSELLSKTLADADADVSLFNFVYDSMLWLDGSASDYANFPLVFAIQLTSYLGFSPNMESYSDGYSFDLLDGNFKIANSDLYQIDEELSRAFYGICRSLREYHAVDSNCQQLELSNNSRRLLLDAMVTYYKLHAENIGEIKSHEILRCVFAARDVVNPIRKDQFN